MEKKTHKDNTLVEMYRAIREEYAYDGSVMSQDEAHIARLKYIINNRLSVVDKTIILLYAETMSLRKVGKMIGVSHATIRTEVNRIREIIKKEYEHND